jgi:hypothetical protein
MKHATSPAPARQIPAMIVTLTNQFSLNVEGAGRGGGGGIHSNLESMTFKPD